MSVSPSNSIDSFVDVMATNREDLDKVSEVTGQLNSDTAKLKAEIDILVSASALTKEELERKVVELEEAMKVKMVSLEKAVESVVMNTSKTPK